MDFKYISLDYLKLMADNDQNMEKVMLEMLLEDLDAQIPKLERSIQQEDWSLVGNLSHHLKSSFAFIGNGELSTAVKIIEKAANSSTAMPLIQQHMTNITQLLPFAKEELRNALTQLK